MEKIFILSALLAASFNINAATLTFDDPNDLGVTLGGRMMWSNVGGGHLYDETYSATSSIFFANPTYINSFDLNNKPFEGFDPSANKNNRLYPVKAFNESGIEIYSQLIDLYEYKYWSTWLTLTLDLANVKELRFGPSMVFAWPSIDNLVINEQASVSAVPIPAAAFLFAPALLGFMGLRRKAKNSVA